MTSAQATQDKKLLDPENNLISVSTQKSAKFFIYIAKIFLKKFETVELSSLGNAAEVAVQVAEHLSRFLFAEITQINSESIEIEGREGRPAKAIRFTVKLRRSKDFNKLVGDSLK